MKLERKFIEKPLKASSPFFYIYSHSWFVPIIISIWNILYLHPFFSKKSFIRKTAFNRKKTDKSCISEVFIPIKNNFLFRLILRKFGTRPLWIFLQIISEQQLDFTNFSYVKKTVIYSSILSNLINSDILSFSFSSKGVYYLKKFHWFRLFQF